MLVTVDVTSFFIINQTTCLSSNFQAVQHCHCQCFSCFSLPFSLSRKRTCLPSNLQTVLLLPSATSANCTSKGPVRLPDLVLIKCSYNVSYIKQENRQGFHQLLSYVKPCLELTCGSRRRGTCTSCWRPELAISKLQTVGTLSQSLLSPATGRFLQIELLLALLCDAVKGTCQKRFSGFCPLRGGGVPPNSVKGFWAQ